MKVTMEEYAREMENKFGSTAKANVTWGDVTDLFARIHILEDRIKDLYEIMDYEDLKDTENSIIADMHPF